MIIEKKQILHERQHDGVAEHKLPEIETTKQPLIEITTKVAEAEHPSEDEQHE